MPYRVGIDVGGTHTDAVVLDPDLRCIAKVKVTTTDDVMVGIHQALKQVIAKGSIKPEQIEYAMLGTTHCTNAIVERKQLNKAGIIRIAKPATLALPPLIDWPDDLRKRLGNHSYIVSGGYEFNGREITSFDEKEVRNVCKKMKGQVDSVAISSVFSPVNADHEKCAAKIVQEELPDVSVSLSHQIGSIGLLERENATVLNAALIQTAHQVVHGFCQALERERVQAKVFLGQNDGTLMSVEYALQYPIFTIACGPTNSIRGAAYLSGIDHAVVVDVGGTTTDVGYLVNGFPRQSAIAVEIGGVKTNFRMPDILSIGLGGGTVIHLDEDPPSVGPESVGFQLATQAMVFGGSIVTATDIAVAMNQLSWSKDHLLNLDQKQCKKAYQIMVHKVEECIDRIKTSAQPIPAILVGGGSVLFPDHLKGVSQVIRPADYDVANAVGVALGQVSGHTDQMYSLDEITHEQAIISAKQTAINETIQAGAEPSTVTIIDVEEVPLSYLPGNATRIRVKAAGSSTKGSPR